MRFLLSTQVVIAWMGLTSWLLATPFAIHVVDEETGRGVPLVELKTTSDQTYVTDSNGYVAIDDPTLTGQKVFFHVSSHGYEYPQDGFGFRGKALNVEPGTEVTLWIKRTNIAERLYRITGAGIYRDSMKLKKDVPIRRPLLNGLVTGQDTVQAVRKGDTIYWFWGDTERLAYPLGQFNTSGAVSTIPSAGGLDPARGIDLEYFTDAEGFSRPMFRRENGVLIWVHGAFGINGPDGEARIVTHYSRRKSLQHQLSHGLAVLDESEHRLQPLVDYDEDEQLYPRGQSFRSQHNDTEYICFADPYAQVRVPAKWSAVIDPRQYEAFTPLKVGSPIADPQHLDRGADGKLQYAWKQDTAPVSQSLLRAWVQQKLIEDDEDWFRTVDAASGEPLLLHRGSLHWNAYRDRWIMIAHESGGSPSFLGEVWYSEAQQPEGPFAKAVKIVSHDRYSFYNVAHHDFFDQEGGRVIYFEGTYTTLFAGSVTPTPWYDYNQIMYRLDLADPRLQPALVE